MFIVIPQNYCCNWWFKLSLQYYFGPAVINAMILAGVSLIIGGLANFLITDKKVITHQAEDNKVLN